jgi:hypothetical protein
MPCAVPQWYERRANDLVRRGYRSHRGGFTSIPWIRSEAAASRRHLHDEQSSLLRWTGSRDQLAVPSIALLSPR